MNGYQRKRILAGIKSGRWYSQLAHHHCPFAMPYTLLCIVIGGTTPFAVKIDETQLVDELKKAIKKEAEHTCRAFDAYELTLYKINIDISNDNTCDKIIHDISRGDYKFSEKRKLNPTFKVSEYSGETGFPEKTIHIFVEFPSGEPIDQGLW
jgi:Crinkler effector protein N-terminal domain